MNSQSSEWNSTVPGCFKQVISLKLANLTISPRGPGNPACPCGPAGP